jgi:hypothetical protein
MSNDSSIATNKSSIEEPQPIIFENENLELLFKTPSDFFTDKEFIFENKPLDLTNIPLPINDATFGILKLNASSSPLTIDNHDIIFMVDRSGSMSDMCSDGRSKMQHICHTLTNMINYIKNNKSINAYITINAFDDIIYNVVERCQITDDNSYSILCKIPKLYPKNSTNIELALNNINETAINIKQLYPNNQITSIFMTDGEVSTGKNDPEFLSEIVDKSIANYFIGFGIDHDSVLLNQLGNLNNSNYCCIFWFSY